VRRLAVRRRRVVRYDHRDTGVDELSAGAPGYTGADLTTIRSPCSTASGSTARTWWACPWAVASPSAWPSAPRPSGHADARRHEPGRRQRTRPAGIAPRLRAALADPKPEPDFDDREAVIRHLVEIERPYAGPDTFDEPRRRAIAARVADRSCDVAAALRTTGW
jgi:hypothetical protein